MFKPLFSRWKPWFSTVLRKTSTVRPATKPFLFLTGTMLVLYWAQPAHAKSKSPIQGPLLVAANKYIQPKYKMKDPNVTVAFKEKLAKFLRILQLFLIFLPSLVLLPLRMFRLTENIWFSVFVWGIEGAGVVWIKGFQYLSHRRDIIGEKMAQKFMHLRQKAPPHPFAATQATFLHEFGKPVQQIFEQFNPVPVGTGSVGQVYEAVFEGKRVAVKVRHPHVEKNIERDIDIIFFFSRILSKFSRYFQVPVTNYSLKRTLINQVDFNVEAQNLMRFIEQYKDSQNIHFPTPILSRQPILVQDFVEGYPITHFESLQNPFNKQMARVGAGVFFQMLMIHNFIHADLHGGNIMVQIKDYNLTPTQWLKDRWYLVQRWFESKYIEYFETNLTIRDLYLENQAEEDDVREVQRREGKRVEITLIDVGMILTMGKQEQEKFITFIESIIKKKPQVCANMIYNLSMQRGKPISELPKTQQFQRYYSTLLDLFSRLTEIKIKELQGLTLLKGMLDIIRDYRMSLDGQFATLLTNILILEQIGKDLNPQINILKCAVPYFKSTFRGM